MSSFMLYSSDSHILEPPDLWTNRIDPEFRERAPYVARDETTDQWYADGDIKFGSMAAGIQPGLRFDAPEKMSFEGRYEDVRRGGFDPHAHVTDMDLDGVAGGVLYPSMALTLYSIPSSDLLSATFRAYNDWLADFCRPYPNRLKGIGMLNVDNVDEAVEELQRVTKLGLAGAMIALRPLGASYNHPDYEPLWATAEELDMPLSLHTGTFRWRPDGNQTAIMVTQPEEQTNREYHVRNSIAAIIFSGVFERHPNLRVGAIEFEISWAPYFMGRMDDTYRERIVGQQIARFRNNALPSDIFRSNIFISFQEDGLGIQLRSLVGVDNLLWGSDYPHSESTFPKSREIVDRIFQGIPEEDKIKITATNTAKLYKFN